LIIKTHHHFQLLLSDKVTIVAALYTKLTSYTVGTALITTTGKF